MRTKQNNESIKEPMIAGRRLSLLDVMDEVQGEIDRIKNGSLPLDRAKETSKLRKIQVQQHGLVQSGLKMMVKHGSAPLDARRQIAHQLGIKLADAGGPDGKKSLESRRA